MILRLFLAWTSIILVAFSVGLFEAFVIGPLRPPEETYGGLVAIVMLFAVVPVGGFYLLWLAATDDF